MSQHLSSAIRLRDAGQGREQGYRKRHLGAHQTIAATAQRTLPVIDWDRGKELADHQRLTLATEVDVYFCDPRCHGSGGSNENTNRLLRQYLPRAPICPCIAKPSSAPSQGSSTKGRERPCSIRPQLRSSQNVLRRSVEPRRHKRPIASDVMGMSAFTPMRTRSPPEHVSFVPQADIGTDRSPR